jgi:hypothetical protein
VSCLPRRRALGTDEAGRVSCTSAQARETCTFLLTSARVISLRSTTRSTASTQPGSRVARTVHNFARSALQRRTEQEWRLLALASRVVARHVRTKYRSTGNSPVNNFVVEPPDTFVPVYTNVNGTVRVQSCNSANICSNPSVSVTVFQQPQCTNF